MLARRLLKQRSILSVSTFNSIKRMSAGGGQRCKRSSEKKRIFVNTAPTPTSSYTAYHMRLTRDFGLIRAFVLQHFELYDCNVYSGGFWIGMRQQVVAFAAFTPARKKYFYMLFTRWAAHRFAFENEDGEPFAIDTSVVFCVIEQLTNIIMKSAAKKDASWGEEGLMIALARNSIGDMVGSQQ